MSIEQSRGAEPPAGGPPSSSSEGASIQILSTEHWSLLATRSVGYTDFFGRANMFFSVLTGTVIALALIAQTGRGGATLVAAAILMLSIVIFVGVTTIVRVGQLTYQDGRWISGMNRIRHAYLDLHPELRQYFITSPHDDMRGIILTTTGLAEGPLIGQSFLSDLGHGVTTMAGMLMIIVAAVIGAWGALISVAFGASQALAIAIGAACFVITIAGNIVYGRRRFRGFAKGPAPMFPTP